jgi:predicted transcriptional regulator of viral defense system
MDTQTFFTTHPVFTVDEFDRYLESCGSESRFSRNRLLGYYRATNRLISVRNGLYAVAAPGVEPARSPVDSFLVASALRKDSVLAYHTALELHGVAHSLREEGQILTRHPMSARFEFRGVRYRTVQPSAALPDEDAMSLGVVAASRGYLTLRVTGLERTLVDCLDRLRLAGGYEEVWRSYESVPYLDLELTVRYALLLSNATTIASVGYFLEMQRTQWMVSNDYLERLAVHRPDHKHYLDRSRSAAGKLVSRWNLVVPEAVFYRTWEEPDEPLA